MPPSELCAQSLDSLVEQCISQARLQTGIPGEPAVVVSPYRFNPLGAHIDHQGGSVLARCLDQYTILCAWPSVDASSTISSAIAGTWQQASFSVGELDDTHGWDAMARASAAALDKHATRKNGNLQRGIHAVVFGTLVSGGLSSSASVILAYLSAFAFVNEITLSSIELVELSRQVEQDYRGLNNGIQDQMSIAFGQADHLTLMNVEAVTAKLIPDPQSIDDVAFLMCYSGVSRDLAGSPFNTRVAECQQAATLLSPGVAHLGEVALELRDEDHLAQLPALPQRRARHVYSEMARVSEGAKAWGSGDWQAFGQLMNASCQSSIHHYESGSEWLIALHEMACSIKGVYGNRFSGGGYGGCLFMLVEAAGMSEIASALMGQYTARYPEHKALARINIAQSESTVRILA